MNIHRLYEIFFNYFRSRRMQKFREIFSHSTELRVLDIGGDEFNWLLLSPGCHLTFINLYVPKERKTNFAWIIGDGRYLPFKDGTFDIVYSNSVIEHLNNYEDQSLFASECRRIGKRYYIQTPNKSFFMEPHLITPFIHWLPRMIKVRLLRNFTVWGLITRPSFEYCVSFLNEIRLLDKKELHQLFPDADILHERFCGMSKSLIAAKCSYQ